jgi:hypothetical protein
MKVLRRKRSRCSSLNFSVFVQTHVDRVIGKAHGILSALLMATLKWLAT